MIRILVTAMGGGGHGEQILKALRLAGNGLYWIVGADANPKCPQFDMVDQRAVLPLASSPRYLDELLALIERHRIRALFHGCEPELRLFARNRDEIERRGVFLPVNPTPVIDLCMDKEKTNRRLLELGFAPPRFAVVEGTADLASIDWFPVVVKPSLGGGGSANVYIAQNPRELCGLAQFLNLGANDIRFFIQEYVGTPDAEYTVGVLHDMDGEYVNSIAVRRALTGQLSIRTSVPNSTGRGELGPRLIISSGISQGEIDRFPEVSEQCSAIARAIGARGPLNIQCRLVKGVVKVFEINPRFSGTTSLRAMVGYNEPDLLIRRHLLHQKLEAGFPYGRGLILRNLTEHYYG
ncbi:ATP-grasp domain-containing protein [Accumulibacter sp.]|uniref:ATP-grasp domain-containing protein n=1 Tax=Accumulibacter sp. TaxID=2053492 RepID=UPI0025FC22A7|nr:ATP-grasp domain-containing protein [Accumulibacter sp.]MCM8612108.1 ATP-grasp domain-containing protein [Accumulibacter sp.]MCM8635774.1 ATP-grasp domain-containing protein [Accumulibacter sp.]MCM8639589.1 ATP-grasp domain-containing protein [Accumulibacter sp.]